MRCIKLWPRELCGLWCRRFTRILDVRFVFRLGSATQGHSIFACCIRLAPGLLLAFLPLLSRVHKCPYTHTSTVSHTHARARATVCFVAGPNSRAAIFCCCCCCCFGCKFMECFDTSHLSSSHWGRIWLCVVDGLLAIYAVRETVCMQNRFFPAYVASRQLCRACGVFSLWCRPSSVLSRSARRSGHFCIFPPFSCPRSALFYCHRTNS